MGGSVGQIAVQAAKALGARRVVAAGRDRETLDAVQDRGAGAVVTLDEAYEGRLAGASEGGASTSPSTLCSARLWQPASRRPAWAAESSTSGCEPAGPSNSAGSPSKSETCSPAASAWCRSMSGRGPSAT
ncbi:MULTISPECIES: zinc-binding dehydrogenase [Rhodococcus erythropolis group]|uniref:zinc-binding dehydrogenase n=1 Tax=Rhodococcus erythropolis group TaxID=2840174 RepID=UPI00352FB289